MGADVASPVELRWRPSEHHLISVTSGYDTADDPAFEGSPQCPQVLAVVAVAKLRMALAIPAAHQRNAYYQSRQRLTLPTCSRHTEIIDPMALGERSVPARFGGISRGSVVRVSSRPSRRLAVAPGRVRSCLRCLHWVFSPKAVAAHIGPVCRAKVAGR